MGPVLFWVLVVVLIAGRLVLASCQDVYVWIDGAPLDDELMFRAAQSITAGNWLGAYDYLTLSKQMFFAVWLAFLHLLGVPYLMGRAAAYVRRGAGGGLCPGPGAAPPLDAAGGVQPAGLQPRRRGQFYPAGSTGTTSSRPCACTPLPGSSGRRCAAPGRCAVSWAGW